MIDNDVLETLHWALRALEVARHNVELIDAHVRTVEAPHLKAAAKASADARGLLVNNKAAEADAKATATSAYNDLVSSRHAMLVAGEEVPEIPLPDGWTVQLRQKVEVAFPSRVPRELCEPSLKAVKAALKTRNSVPGVATTSTPTFVRRSQEHE